LVNDLNYLEKGKREIMFSWRKRRERRSLPPVSAEIDPMIIGGDLPSGRLGATYIELEMRKKGKAGLISSLGGKRVPSRIWGGKRREKGFIIYP